jgi:hypothetical protein
MQKNNYNSRTLINNFNEDRFDSSYKDQVVKPRLLSDREQLWKTTHQTEFCKQNTYDASKTIHQRQQEMSSSFNSGTLRESESKSPPPVDPVRLSKAFPGHQPELDPHVTNGTYHPFIATSKSHYKSPDRQPRLKDDIVLEEKPEVAEYRNTVSTLTLVLTCSGQNHQPFIRMLLIRQSTRQVSVITSIKQSTTFRVTKNNIYKCAGALHKL